VIAATLAADGLDVIVVEASEYFNESDFSNLDLDAYAKMYWRGGSNPTADGNVSIMAGTTLGGGTTINWMNCLRTRDGVRAEWANAGLEGVDGPDYDAHLDAVLERISANDACSDLNGPHQRMKEGTEKLGWSFKTIVRNTDRETYSPDNAGYVGFGDRSGSKQSGTKTYLADAAAKGARFLVRTRVAKVLTDGGAASGIEATQIHPDGTTTAVTIRAPRVVVACGSLESPALLLRSGIGGAAVGENLHLHPCARRSSASTPRTSVPGGARRRRRSATSSPTPATATATSSSPASTRPP